MLEIRTLIEVALRGARKEAKLPLRELALILLADEPVLLMYNTEVRKYLDGLMPCRVHRFILSRGHGEELGELHPKGDRDIGILTDQTTLLNSKQRELGLQATGLALVSHLLDDLSRWNKCRTLRR